MAYGFSPADLLANIDSQTMFILVAFLAFFAVIFLALKGFRIFQQNKGASAVIAIVLSLGATWYLNTSFRIENIFGSLGLGNIDLFPYLLVLFLALFFFFVYQYKNKTFLALGALFIILPFTGLLYESGIILALGVLFLIIGFVWGHRIKKKERALALANQGNPNVTNVYNEFNSPIYQQRQRSLYDLKQKYMAYLFGYNKRGLTADYRRRILQAMNTIIDYAKKVGVSKSDFLSKKIGGTNAKAPEDLRPPFDG